MKHNYVDFITENYNRNFAVKYKENWIKTKPLIFKIYFIEEHQNYVTLYLIDRNGECKTVNCNTSEFFRDNQMKLSKDDKIIIFPFYIGATIYKGLSYIKASKLADLNSFDEIPTKIGISEEYIIDKFHNLAIIEEI